MQQDSRHAKNIVSIMLIGFMFFYKTVQGMERWIEVDRSGWKRKEGMEGWIEVDRSGWKGG